jgi:hypothetical protein
MTGGGGGGGGNADVGPDPGDVPGSTLTSSVDPEAEAAMIGWGLGLGGGVLVLVLVAGDARGVGGLDVPRRLALALAVVLFEGGRTERVERVGGRILVCVSTRIYIYGRTKRMVSREVVVKERDADLAAFSGSPLARFDCQLDHLLNNSTCREIHVRTPRP